MLQLPDIASTYIPASDVLVELREGSTAVGIANIDLVKVGDYFQTASEVLFDVFENKSYTVFVKTKVTVGRSFAGVNLTQSQTLDCVVGEDTACGELISKRDSKLLLSGDSFGFNTGSGSYNRINSADLQALSAYFNKSSAESASAVDLNIDGKVNIGDLEVFGKNYGLQGD